VGKRDPKSIVLDDRTVIGGSFDYTGPANRYNDGILFLMCDPDVLPAGFAYERDGRRQV